MARVLLLLPVAGYRNEDFLAAAQRLEVEVIAIADYCPRLAPRWGLSPLAAVPFDRPQLAVEIVLKHLTARPDAVLAADDHGVELAALLRERLGLAGNPPAAVARLRDKLEFRQLLREAALSCPPFAHLPDEVEPDTWQPPCDYPVVVKARRLSASRAVVRADDAASFASAVRQARRIQRYADRQAGQLGLLVEAFIPGREYALEGLLDDGRLRVLALFDKPDPLDGPYFEETLYVTPSRLPAATQQAIADAVQRACRAAGLVTGPVHAEMRVNDAGVWLLEIAPRAIGGLCGRVLRHALGMSLEELILRHALGQPVPEATAGEGAGVMMIPIPRRGIYEGVDHLQKAAAVPGITDIQITVEAGTLLKPVPEGASYLGFIFARAADATAAETALRAAHAQLALRIRPEVELVPSDG
ncbi:ATP-grasp domain-containing protein [Thiobacter aerophilum]|uniref:ATP-grasp domain-containing protein n=1 Tax=Thiobacter aerophilum TaxID=3121275 RepID=A0ABV0ECB9_9BURK